MIKKVAVSKALKKAISGFGTSGHLLLVLYGNLDVVVLEGIF